MAAWPVSLRSFGRAPAAIKAIERLLQTNLLLKRTSPHSEIQLFEVAIALTERIDRIARRLILLHKVVFDAAYGEKTEPT